MNHILQKAKIDGQLLEVTVDLAQMVEWKQGVFRDLVKIINDPDVTEDDRDMSRTTLADGLSLYEGLAEDFMNAH